MSMENSISQEPFWTGAIRLCVGVTGFKATVGVGGQIEYLGTGKQTCYLAAFLLGFRAYCYDVATVHKIYSSLPFPSSPPLCSLFSLLPCCFPGLPLPFHMGFQMEA